MLYLNGAVGQKDTDVELYILLLHYRRPPDPESIFQQFIPPQVYTQQNMNFKEVDVFFGQLASTSRAWKPS